MILNEFQLACDENTLPDTVPFHSQARCTMALFEYHLPRIVTKDFCKIYIQFSSKDKEKTFISSGVVQTIKRGGIGNFYNLTTQQKKIFALELLEKSLPPILKQLQLDIKPFLLAAKKVREDNYNNYWMQKPKWHASRKYRGYLYCKHEPEYFKGILKIETKSGKIIAKKEVIRTYPSEDCYWRLIKSVTWKNKNKLYCLDADGKEIDYLNLTDYI